MESSSRNWQNGGSMIINPKGEIIAGPLIDQEGILYADIDLLLIVKERQNLDISGHYSRFDILISPEIGVDDSSSTQTISWSDVFFF